MSKAISESEKMKVLSLKIQGYTNSEINEKTGISTGQISNITADYTKSLQINDPRAAFSFFKLVSNNNISLDNAFANIAISSIISDLGMSFDDAKDVLGCVRDAGSDSSLDASKVIESCVLLEQMSEKHGIDKADIFEFVRQKKQELDDIINCTHTAKQEQDIAKKELDSALETNKTALSEISKYCKLRESLKNEGLDIEDVSKLIPVMRHAKSNSYDPQKMVSKLQESDNLDHSIKQQRDTDSELKAQNHSLKRQNSELQAKIRENTPVVKKLDSLESMGVGYDNLDVLCKKIQQISAKNKISEIKAFEKFCNDATKQYDAKLGFENTSNSLQKSITVAKEDLCQVKQSLEVMKKEYQEQDMAIEFLKDLQNKGIFTNSIIQWQNTIKRCGMTLMEFHQEIKNANDLKKMIGNLQKTKLKLSQDNQTLQGNNEQLNSQKNRLTGEVDAFLRIKEKLTEIAKHTARQYASEMKYRQEDILNSLKRGADETSKKWNEQSEIISSARETIARASFLDPVYKLVATKSGDKTKVFPPVYDILASMEIWLHDDRILCSKINALKGEIYSALSRHAAA